MYDLRFDLNDDLSVTELRNIDAWQSRLSGAGKLRLQRRGEVVGVLLSPDEWLALKAHVEVLGDAPAVAQTIVAPEIAAPVLEVPSPEIVPAPLSVAETVPAVRAPADAIRELVKTLNIL